MSAKGIFQSHTCRHLHIFLYISLLLFMSCLTVLINKVFVCLLFCLSRSVRGSPVEACQRTGLLHQRGSMWSLFTKTQGRTCFTARTTSWCNRYERTNISHSVNSLLLSSVHLLKLCDLDFLCNLGCFPERRLFCLLCSVFVFFLTEL